MATNNVTFFQLVIWNPTISDKSSRCTCVWRYQELFWSNVFCSPPEFEVTASLGQGRFSVVNRERGPDECCLTPSRLAHWFLCLLVIPPLVMLIARACFRLSSTRFEKIPLHLRPRLEIDGSQKKLDDSADSSPEIVGGSGDEDPSGGGVEQERSVLKAEDSPVFRAESPDRVQPAPVEEDREKLKFYYYLRNKDIPSEERIKVLTELLEKSPGLANEDLEGWTPMHYALFLREDEIYQLLCRHGSVRPSTKDVLIMRTGRDKLGMFVSHPCGLTIPKGLTPLEARAYFYHAIAVDVLLTRIEGKAYNSQFSYPLPWGEEASLEEIYGYLSAQYLNGEHTLQGSRYGLTLLHYVHFYSAPAIAERLIALGADPQVQSTASVKIGCSCEDRFGDEIPQGCTPIELQQAFKNLIIRKTIFQWIRGKKGDLCFYFDRSQEKVLPFSPLSLETALDEISPEALAAKDRVGLTLLHYASLYEHEDATVRLLTKKADNSVRQISIRMETSTEIEEDRYPLDFIVECAPTQFKEYFLPEFCRQAICRSLGGSLHPPKVFFAYEENTYLRRELKKNLSVWLKKLTDIDKPVTLFRTGKYLDTAFRYEKIASKYPPLTHLIKRLIETKTLRHYNSHPLQYEEMHVVLSGLIAAGADLYNAVPVEEDEDPPFSNYELLAHTYEKQKSLPKKLLKLIETLTKERQQAIQKSLGELTLFPAALEQLVAEYVV